MARLRVVTSHGNMEANKIVEGEHGLILRDSHGEQCGYVKYGNLDRVEPGEDGGDKS